MAVQTVAAQLQQEGQGEQPGRWRLLEIVPAEVDAVAAMRQGAALRATGAWRVVERAAGRWSAIGPLTEAWGSLAKSLAMPPEEAFARLLGDEAVFFVQAGADGRGGVRVQWALASLVQLDAAQRLERALAGAPRLVVEGAPVLAIEGGRYWLTRLNRAEGVVLLFVPAEQTGLLRQTLRLERASHRRKAAGQRRSAKAFSQRMGAWREALGRGRALVALRRPDGGWLAATLDAWGDRVRGRLLDEPVAPLVPVAEDSSATLATLAPGAIALVVERAAEGAEGGRSLLAAPLTAMWLGRLLQGQPALAERLTGVRLYRVATERDGPTAAFALRLRQAKTAAPLVDASMAALAAQLLGEEAASPTTLDFGGAFPASVRTLPAAWPPLASLQRQGAQLSWRIAPDEQAPARPAAGPGEGDGWWVIGAGARSVEAMERALARAAQTEAAQKGGQAASAWLQFGVARPADLAPLLSRDSGGPLQALLQAAAATERAHWRALRTGEGAVLLTFELRLAGEAPGEGG